MGVVAMLTKTQGRLLGAGYVQVIEREKRALQQMTVVISWRGDGGRDECMRHLQQVQKSLPYATARIEDESPMTRDKIQALIDEEVAERVARVKADYERKLADARAWAETVADIGKKHPEGMTIGEFAKQQGVSYATVYRAVLDGRIKYRTISEGARNSYIVYPETYVPKKSKGKKR